MNLYEHTDYRCVLRAWVEEDPRRSQAGLARRVGTSRTNVTMILQTTRGIALSSARAWGRAIGLESHDDLSYWEALVRAEHGESLALRRAARQYVRAMRDFMGAPRPAPTATELFGLWYVPVVMQLVSAVGMPQDAAALAERIWPEVDPDEMRAALEAMEAAGLFAARTVATDRDLEGRLAEVARVFHQSQLEHAKEALEVFPSDERFLASLAVAIRRAQLPDLVSALHRFQLEVVEPFRADEPDMVVQLSVQLFPRSHP